METPPTMREFFDRPDVKALQDVQRSNHWGSPKHRAAFERMRDLAMRAGIDGVAYFGEYDS